MGKPRRKLARQHRKRPDVFAADAADRAFVPEADVLARVDLNTGRRAVAVRAGFMEALVGDPRIVRLFTGWLEQLAANPESLTTNDALPLVRNELGLPWPWCVVA